MQFSESPQVEAIAFTLSLYFAQPIALLWVIAFTLANSYIILWGLDNADVTSFGLKGEELYFLKLLRLPITYLERFIAYITESEQFDTTDDFSIWLFSTAIRPFVYLFTSSMSPLVVMVNPVLMFFYLFDRNIFVDDSATLANGNGTQTMAPHDGIPAAYVEYYELNALMWNNYSYLYGTKEAGISLTHFILIQIWAQTQLLMTIFFDPIAIIFAIFISWSMFSIYMYEFYILGNTWDVRDETEIEVDTDIVNDDDTYDGCESMLCNLLS